MTRRSNARRVSVTAGSRAIAFAGPIGVVHPTASCRRPSATDAYPSTLPSYRSTGRGDLGLDDCRRYEELGVHCLQIGVIQLDDLDRFAGAGAAGARSRLNEPVSRAG